MIAGCDPPDLSGVSPIRIGSLASALWRRLLVSSVIPSGGFVEGLNNKIRVIQRRAYGLRDEEYLRLKILTTMLPDLPADRIRRK